MPERVPGRRGRKPARAPADRFPLRFIHDYAVTPLPAPRYPVDVSGGITGWGMLGNGPDPSCTIAPDGVGDCTFAGRQHARMAKAAAAQLTGTWETSDELVREYLAYDGGQDQGAVIADLLLSWYQDGKILAFAPVDHASPSAVDGAMQAFRGAYCGVSLTDDADDLFSGGQPWGTGSITPDTADGHCIIKVKSDGLHFDTWVTWGQEQLSTLAWTAACLDEAWVLVTADDEAAKVDMAALVADIRALGGRDVAA
jgi:hypothetical protein